MPHRFIVGDALEVLRSLPDDNADAAITSPPYLDARPEYPSPSLHEFEDIFREMARVVDGPFLLNVGRLWRQRQEQLWWMALLERAEWAGWPLADTLIWIKPNANPIHGAVLANSHEYVFLLGDAKWYDADAVRTPYAPESVARMSRRWRNGTSVKGHVKETGARRLNPLGARPRSYVTINTGREKGIGHPAPMALDLAEHLVKLSGGSTILDPFAGSGSTGLAAERAGRSSILIDENAAWMAEAERRIAA